MCWILIFWKSLYLIAGANYVIASGVEVDAGFDGCIAKLKIGNHRSKAITFSQDVIEAANVKDCSALESTKILDAKATCIDPCKCQDFQK